MASIITNYINSRFLNETWENNFGQEDPLFERIPATQLHGIPLKPRHRISEHDEKILSKVKRRAYHLDLALWTVCGVRFGWGSVIAIIPGIGDVLDSVMAIMVINTCQHIEGGLPLDITLKMYLNVILDFLIGLVPIVGDVMDAVLRVNVQNAVILERYLQENGSKTFRARDGIRPMLDDRHLEEPHGQSWV